MIKKLISPILLAVAVGGGVFAGQMAKAKMAPAPAGGDHYEAGDKGGHGKSKGHGKSDGHGGDKVADSLDMNVSYLKFKRQFVVPVLGDEGVDALILLNIAISLEENSKDEMFNHEPKFRDAFIRELLQMSDAGYFNESLTAPSTYEAMRETLIRAARDVSPEGVADVLILDFARQDR